MWSPGDLPDLTQDPDALQINGQILDEPCERWAVQWDPRPDYTGPAVDLGWIGEDAKGVWCCVHPLAALIDNEPLALAVTTFQCGQSEISRADWAELSAWQYDIKLIMAGAKGRKDYPTKGANT